MSDAKAKSEARRAKILARENNRLSVAKGEKEAVEQEQIDEDKQKGRPLAARRNLVKKISSDIPSNSDENTIESNTELSDKSHDKQEVNENVVEEKIVDSTDKSTDEPKLVITPKSTKQIEKEIAENTAKFDKNVLDKSNKKVPKKTVVPSNNLLSVPFQAVHAMKVIRLLGVIIIGVIMGYRSSLYHSKKILSLNSYNPKILKNFMNQASKINENTNEAMIISEDDEVNDSKEKLKAFIQNENGNQNSQEYSSLNSNELFDYIHSKKSFSTVLNNGTWIGWIIDYFIRQAESTLTAVSLAWWITSLLNPLINKLMSSSRFQNVNNKNNNGILGKLFDIYAKGVEGLIEGSLNTIGDLALHFFVIVVTSLIVTFFFNENDKIPIHSEL